MKILVFLLIATSCQAQTLRTLRLEYQESNKEYFQNKLPKDTEIKLTKNLLNSEGRSSMATTFCIHSDGKLHCTIQINPDKNPVDRTAIITLYHEECHVKLWGRTEDGEEHGSLFQSCMLDLAEKGAFKELW